MKIREKRIFKSCRYFLSSSIAEPTLSDFEFWISSLLEPMRTGFKNRGVEGCRRLFDFQLFVLQKRKPLLKRFLYEELSVADYNYWEKKEEEFLEKLCQQIGFIPTS